MSSGETTKTNDTEHDETSPGTQPQVLFAD